MRTTITVDGRLLERLKARAAATGTTVSRLIEEAVRVMLNRTPKRSEPGMMFELITYGAGGQFSKYNLDKTSELIAAGDQERYGGAPPEQSASGSKPGRASTRRGRRPQRR